MQCAFDTWGYGKLKKGHPSLKLLQKKKKMEAHQRPYIQHKTPEQSPRPKEHTNIQIFLTKSVYDVYINKFMILR